MMVLHVLQITGACSPSFAFAWRVNEEGFLKNVKWLSNLKLRLGYGKTGQQEGISNYIWFKQYKKGQNFGKYPVIGDGSIYTPLYYNDKLKWETTETYNAGLDFGFLDNRLNGTIDVYKRKTKDLINDAPCSSTCRFCHKGLQNIGSLENKGVEIALIGFLFSTKDWYWTMSYNFTYNDNKIYKLNGVSDNGDPVLVGENIDQSNKVLAYQTGYACQFVLCISSSCMTRMESQ